METTQSRASIDSKPGPQIFDITEISWIDFKTEVMHIQNTCYEPGRRDSEQFFRGIIANPRSICLAALIDKHLAGYAFAGPLELFRNVHGVLEDENFGHGNTLYGADVTVSEKYRGRGIGQALKHAQIERAKSLGFHYVTGRNRVGMAQAMWRLNQQLGAVEVARIKNDYPDGPEPRDAIYYRIPLPGCDGN